MIASLAAHTCAHAREKARLPEIAPSGAAADYRAGPYGENPAAQGGSREIADKVNSGNLSRESWLNVSTSVFMLVPLKSQVREVGIT